MSKILKVKIRLPYLKTLGRMLRVYPAEYDKTKVKVLCHESIHHKADILARDDSADHSIVVVSNADAPGFLKSADITELNIADAKTQGAIWRPQVTTINDPDKVIALVAKLDAGEVLTNEEKDAIDPDNTTKGIIKSASFSDMLTREL